jgi:hypothetical protein
VTGSTEFDGAAPPSRSDGAGAVSPESDPSPWAAHSRSPQVVVQSVVTVAPPAALSDDDACTMPYPAQAPARPAAVPDESWPTREMMAGRTVRGHRTPPSRPAPKPDSPVRGNSALGLTGLVLFALLAAFFAWVTAEPMWLAMGHGDDGRATVLQCVGSGVSQRCVGDFTSESGTVVERVALLGVDQAALAGQGEPAQLTARMVGARSDQAYVGSALRGLHLRWVVGFALAMLCGLGIALSTGAIRFTERRARRAAIATSFAAPLLLLVGFLAASF